MKRTGDQIEVELLKRISALEFAKTTLNAAGISSTREIDAQIEVLNNLLQFVRG